MSGPIPPELGNLSNLTFLYLSDNDLSGEIPRELGNLAKLQELYLGGNQLEGCVPSSLQGQLISTSHPGDLPLLLKPRALSRGRTAYRPECLARVSSARMAQIKPGGKENDP